MRWSEAGHLSQIVLAHALCQASVSLILGVRQKKQTMYSLTFTQAVFLCCLFVFGPAFGLFAVYRHIDSRLGGLWSFSIACFFAYSGWFISGIVAKLAHPDYGSEYGISELGALLYTIPGFATGWLGLYVLSKISNKNPNKKE